MSRWGRAASLDHKSRASASCYASSGCGGLPFFLGTVVAVWSGARVSMSVSWHSPRALSSLLPRLVCRVVFCACGVPPPEVLALWRVVGDWRLRRRSTPFSLGFLGCLLLRDRRSVVSVFVCLSPAFGRYMGWRETGCFCITTVAYVLPQAQEPPYGVDGAVFRGAVVCVLHGVPLKGAVVVTAVSRPGGTS